MRNKHKIEELERENQRMREEAINKIKFILSDFVLEEDIVKFEEEIIKGYQKLIYLKREILKVQSDISSASLKMDGSIRALKRDIRINDMKKAQKVK